jgi:hypothetical protein
MEAFAMNLLGRECSSEGKWVRAAKVKKSG